MDYTGGVARSVEQREALAQYQRSEADAAYLSLTGSVVTEAMQIAAARAQIQAFSELLAEDRNNLDLVRTAFENGSVTRVDVLTAESQVAADEARLPPLRFVRPALFRDRNFAAGVIFIAIVGLTYYASMALQPPYLQDLMNYPVVTSGFVIGPRGIGTMASMLIVGRLTGRLDIRLLLAVGLGLTAWSFYAMTGWTPNVAARRSSSSL